MSSTLAAPASSHRLGQSAITLHTDQSAFIPTISEIPYTQRVLRRPWVSYLGARPIHRTTLNLDRSKPKLDYMSIYKHVRVLFFISVRFFAVSVLVF